MSNTRTGHVDREKLDGCDVIAKRDRAAGKLKRRGCRCEEVRLPHPVLRLAADGGAAAAGGPWAAAHGRAAPGGSRPGCRAAGVAAPLVGGGFGLFRRVSGAF